MGVQKIVIRGGSAFGGNSLEDLKATLNDGHRLIEMDFLAGQDGRLYSGHDPDTYVAAGGPLSSGMTATCGAVNPKGGHCIPLADVLALLPVGARLFADLKDTFYFPEAAEKVVFGFIDEVEKCGRPHQGVLMAYPPGLAVLKRLKCSMPVCAKHYGKPYVGDEKSAMVLLRKGLRAGATYICAPVPPTFRRFTAACQEVGVELLVPVGGKDDRPKVVEHIRNGVRSFITAYSDDFLAEQWRLSHQV